MHELDHLLDHLSTILPRVDEPYLINGVSIYFAVVSIDFMGLIDKAAMVFAVYAEKIV